MTVDDVASLVLQRADDDNVGLRADNQTWTYREYVEEANARAHLLLSHRPVQAPFHVGVLLENVPDYAFLLGGAALAGAAVVGVNPTRRGAELERDIVHTQCTVLITEQKFLPLLNGLATGVPAEATYLADTDDWAAAVAVFRCLEPPTDEIDASAPFLLIFTSGTSGDPKASICSQRRLAGIAPLIAERRQITSGDTLYCAMPLFHANGLMSGWSAALAGGATLALRRKFSASEFLPDVRLFGATLANYVGKALTYVLATPEAADDADNPLRFVYGNEGSKLDLERFKKRFGCEVSDAYGSSEGGVSIFRVPGMPERALGRGEPGTAIIDPESGQECPRAEFTPQGDLANPDEAVGEIARVADDLDFEGYWNNPEAQEEKTRDGVFWTGDLGYMDADGFVYFIGRNADWMRVDGENIAAVTVESIMARYASAAVVSAYAVPDVDIGDQVMIAMQLVEGASFDPDAFEQFLSEQSGLGPKAVPRYVRISSELPVTASNKIITRALRGEFWECSDPVWIRDGNHYRPMSESDVEELRARLTARGRLPLLAQV